ncbi:MAG: TetR/AcrR family transcriptional regulator [bacterium]
MGQRKRVAARCSPSDLDAQKARILEAARRAFLEKGYLGTSIRTIALEARMSPGLIYFYFCRGKDEIYGRICEEAFGIGIGLLEKAASTPGRARDKLKAMAAAYVRFYTGYPEYFDILSFKDMGFKKVALSKDQRRKLERLSSAMLSLLGSVVEEAVREGSLPARTDRNTTTLALWSVIEGALYIHKRGYLKQSGVALEDLVQAELAILEKGMHLK